jgi:predicted DsbA family dithiol-disulfide isomerase
MTDDGKLSVEIWSDIACPWCYVGKRRFEAALTEFEHAERVSLTWRAFELDPSLPRELPAEPSYAERLARKYRTNVADAQAMIERMTSVAAEEGLDFRFDRIRPGNTFDAHRLLHLAHERGVQDAMKERLLAAYLCEGEPIGDRAMLARQAKTVGIDEAAAAKVLEGDAYAEEVRSEEREAGALGISGVPFFVFGGRFAVSGAQPKNVLVRVLDQVWSELGSVPDAVEPDAVAEGAACGPDGCD